VTPQQEDGRRRVRTVTERRAWRDGKPVQVNGGDENALSEEHVCLVSVRVDKAA